ncbi:NEDD4 family-interacting protein 2, partial [Nibea albiflora]
RLHLSLSIQLHNEDDSSEASTSEQQPCTSASAQASTSSQDQSLAQASPVAGTEESGSRTQGEAEAPPPPYASLTGSNSCNTRDELPQRLPSASTLQRRHNHCPHMTKQRRPKQPPWLLATVEDDEFPPRDDFSDADQLRVGNDGIFMLAFFMAFLFNWIGFCLSFCLTNTIAGRYGAICGFGLSLIKWILIVRFSDYFTGYFNGQYWLWWIFLLLGLLLFFRGFVNYLKVRNMSENMATSHRTRLFFLY